MDQQTVADLTVDELRRLIREVVAETLSEVLADPDEGLELREDIRQRLQRSISTVEAGGETIPADEVAARLGLKW